MRLWQGMEWQKWPGRPRALVRCTGASREGSGGQSRGGGCWSTLRGLLCPVKRKNSLGTLGALMRAAGDESIRFQASHPLSPNPPMGGVNAGQIGMREPAREKAWASLDRCDPARVFSSRTGPGERSMEAGNRVIVRSDAAGCTRGRGGREFGGVGAVADSAVRRGVEWLAAGPGRC